MAFCNSCGAPLTTGTKFCNKCGAAVTGGPVAAARPPAPTGEGSSALKVIFIVFAVIAAIGVLGIATVSFVALRVARNTHVRHEGDHVKVETPFGNVETSKDADQAAKDLGIDIYPGAETQKEGASSAALGNIRTVTAAFESSDPLDKVCAFYRSKFPAAMSTTADRNHCTIVSKDKQNMVTINVESSGDKTKFQITNVSKKAASSD